MAGKSIYTSVILVDIAGNPFKEVVAIYTLNEWDILTNTVSYQTFWSLPVW